jgi:monodechloroaminopyrrolnitrin synthase
VKLSTEHLGNFASLHACVAEADPLNAHSEMRQLCALNRDADLSGILSLLRAILPSPPALQMFSFVDAAASMRDIGFFLGSIRRHGHEPVALVPGLESVLLDLARLTDLPPRETLLHVTVWNPSGSRERSYTGLSDELHLLESVRLATPALESALSGVLALHEISARSLEFVKTCEIVAEHLAKMVDSVVYAFRHVSPATFMAELRPFYDPIQVGGRSYLGPGAVEMPLFVLEHLLWGSRCEHRGYIEFKETYLPYILAPFRAAYALHAGRPSVVERVIAELSSNGSSHVPLEHALRALDRVFDSLLRFRAPHVRLAQKAYEAQPDAHAEVGSGGYAPSMLEELLTLTRQARSRLSMTSTVATDETGSVH